MELDSYYVNYRAELMARPNIKKYNTLREYLAEGGHPDIDATGEVYDFLCAIVCDDPIVITEEGEKVWGAVLDCPFVVDENRAWGIILDAEIACEDDDEYDECGETGRFLLSLAGYCSETNYDKWFKTEESED